MHRTLVLALTILCSLSAYARVAGHVMFVSGKASVQAANGSEQAVKVGQAIEVGDRIITAEGGYVHLKMIDDAYYSLRPNSRFLIEDYVYDADQADHNRVKTQLEAGSVRAITGKAGESNKQGYRLNTPVAAIGVRGTDYIVHHSLDVTRVAVSSGAVVVSAFNEQCSPAGFGACSGDAALLLTANLIGEYIEVNAHKPLPERKQQTWSPQASVPASPDSVMLATEDARTDQARTNVPDVVAQNPQPPQASAFTWGRWQAAETAAVFQDPSLTIRGLNVGYWLAQSVDTVAKGYPQQSQVDFKLTQSQAALRNPDGSWQPAQVNQGNLRVDFAQGSFTTQLSGQYGDHNQSWQLSAAGAVQADGLLAANPFKSDTHTWVNGAVDATASQAAYVFDKRIAQGALVGVTHWRAPSH